MSRDHRLLQQIEFVEERVLNKVFVCLLEIEFVNVEVHVLS